MQTATSPAMSGPSFPRTYRMRPLARYILVVLGLAIAGVSAFGCWYFSTSPEYAGKPGQWGLVGICIGFVLLGACCALWVSMSRVVLHGDSIESIGPIASSRLRNEDILGYRVMQQQNAPPDWVLIPQPGQGKLIRVNQSMGVDELFFQWLGAFPDLDARDRAEAEQELKTDTTLGDTDEERLRNLARARRIAKALSAASFILLVWAFFPRPYLVVIGLLMALPLACIAIAYQSRGLFRLDEQKNDPRPNVAYPFIMPGFLLMLRAVVDFDYVDGGTLAGWSILAGLVVWVLAMSADPKSVQNKFTRFALLFCLMAYGYGATATANCAFDNAPARYFPTRVIEKHVETGRTTSYKMTIAPWGPYKENDEVTVLYPFYQRVQTGDTVCAYLRPGVLKVSWYVVADCPQ